MNIPLGVTELGHYVLSVVEFGKGPPRSYRGRSLAASYFGWSHLEEQPDLSDGGLHFPLVGSGLLRSVPPEEFSACTAATLGDTRGDSIPDPKKIITKLHVNWGHASANQLKRVPVDSGAGNPHLVNFAEDVLGHCDDCKALDKAPHVPIAGTFTASMFNEKVQVVLPFSGDLFALQATDTFSKNSLPLPVQPANPQEVWDASCGGRVGTFGQPKCLQMDECGEWKNDIWTDLRTERRIKVQFHCAGAHPWKLERRNGLARGIHNRLSEDDRFAKGQISSEVQWCPNTMLSANGFSAYQMVFGSNPVDLFGREDQDEDMMFAQDTSLKGQYVQ